METAEKECGALGGLFQAIVNDMKVASQRGVGARRPRPCPSDGWGQGAGVSVPTESPQPELLRARACSGDLRPGPPKHEWGVGSSRGLRRWPAGLPGSLSLPPRAAAHPRPEPRQCCHRENWRNNKPTALNSLPAGRAASAAQPCGARDRRPATSVGPSPPRVPGPPPAP